jgi:hypothetical protein
VALLADRGEIVVILAVRLAAAYRDVDYGGSSLLDLIAGLDHALVAPLTASTAPWPAVVPHSRTGHRAGRDRTANNPVRR